MCIGVFGQMIHIGFDTGIVTVKLASRPDFLNDSHSLATSKAVRAIARELS